MAKDHGNCPHCNVDLNGGSIWQTFMNQYNDEAEADRISEMYGATRTQGTWGRAIGLYDRDKDLTVAYKCPDCGEIWKR